MEGRKEAAAVTLKSTVVRGGETDVEVPVVNLSPFLLKGSFLLSASSTDQQQGLAVNS